MKTQEIEYLVEKINEIINSKPTKLHKSDLERLVIVREKLKSVKSKKGLSKLLAIILGLFIDD